MVTRLFFMLGLLLSADCAAQAQGARRPFVMYGIQLGLSLAEFRQLRFLDDSERQRLEVLCSGDQSPVGLRLSVPDRSEAVRCGIFERGTDPNRLPPLIDFFGYPAHSSFVFFRRPRDNDPILTLASFTISTAHFEEILAIFQKVYGPPSDYELSAAESLFGIRSINATYRWNNSVSSIRLDSLALELDKMSVGFAYDDVLHEINPIDPRVIAPR
jgi:hypothetical protein